MSIARAYVDCLRCYELLGQIKTSTGPEDRLYQLQVKDSQHRARKGALEEIEAVANPYYAECCVLDSAGEIKTKGTKACLNCDFSRPSLAQHLKSDSRTMKGLLEIPESTEQAHNYRTSAKQE